RAADQEVAAPAGDQGVVAGAADQDAGAVAGDQHVVAAQTAKDVANGVAEQHVVVGAAGQVCDIPLDRQGVVAAPDRLGLPLVQPQGRVHTGRGVAEVQGVPAGDGHDPDRAVPGGEGVGVGARAAGEGNGAPVQRGAADAQGVVTRPGVDGQAGEAG